nr:uncharacterized protein LOC109026671 [Gorilla gorilla gorilla]
MEMVARLPTPKLPRWLRVLTPRTPTPFCGPSARWVAHPDWAVGSPLPRRGGTRGRHAAAGAGEATDKEPAGGRKRPRPRPMAAQSLDRGFLEGAWDPCCHCLRLGIHSRLLDPSLQPRWDPCLLPLLALAPGRGRAEETSLEQPSATHRQFPRRGG